MGAKVTVTVKLPDGTTAVGANLRGVNHDAWAKSHKDWMATTNEQGQHAWSNMDTGALGDRYTFSADYVDPEGEQWHGEVSERVKSDLDFTIVLTKSDGAGGLTKPPSK